MIQNQLSFQYSDSSRAYFRISGGLGDVLICSGIVSAAPGHKTVAVPKNYVELISKVKGINQVVPVNKGLDGDYDLMANFDGIFASHSHLMDMEYYEIAAMKVNLKPHVAEFDFWYFDDTPKFDFVLHPASSNPNRMWPIGYWQDLAYSLTSAGFTVGWLGTKYDFGQTKGRMEKLSSINETLLWQAKVISQSKYFIGNDSGFAHIAGILGKRGYVIFSNTRPENVIARYPSLTAITPQDFEPTMSLNPQDSKSLDYLRQITPKSVCDKLSIKFTPSFDRPQEKIKINVIGDFPMLMEKNFEQDSESDIVWDVAENKLKLSGKPYNFYGTHWDLKRYLVEIGY